MKNIKAIIFDLNGVFVISQKLSDRFRQDFGISEEIFLPALKDVMSQVRMPGAQNMYFYWAPYLKKWNVSLNEEKFLDYWFSAEKENSEMVKLAEELKQKNIPLFILSNNLRERSGYYDEHFPFLKTLFQKTYYSWQTGFIKPNKRAYELILKENNLRPEECMYFDDSEENISVAREMEMQGYLFKGSDDVREKLSELLNR